MKKFLLYWLNEIFYIKTIIHSDGIKETEFRIGILGMVLIVIAFILIWGWLIWN